MHCLPHGVYTCDKASARHTGYYRQKKPCGFPWSAVQHPFNCLIEVTCLRSCHDSTDLHLKWVILVWISFPLVNIKSSVCMWKSACPLTRFIIIIFNKCWLHCKSFAINIQLGKIHNYLGLVGSQNTTSRPEDIPEGGALLLCLRHRLACIQWFLIPWGSASSCNICKSFVERTFWRNADKLEQHICFLETIGNNTGNIFQSFFTVLPLPKRTPLYID